MTQTFGEENQQQRMGVILGTKYRLDLLLVDRDETPPWNYAVWTRLAASIELSVGADLTSRSLHCRQVIRGQNRAAINGPFKWTDESFQRWCHDSPTTMGTTGSWLFVDAEVFHPARRECISSYLMPSVYLRLFPSRLTDESKASYDACVLVATAASFAKDHATSFNSLIEGIRHELRLVAHYTATRRIRSLNEFESIYRECFVYRGLHETPLPDLARTKLPWKTRSTEQGGASNGLTPVRWP